MIQAQIVNNMQAFLQGKMMVTLTHEERQIAVVRNLYTDVFHSGNCKAVDIYYQPDAISHFGDKVLSLAEMKVAMQDCISQCRSIKTTIQSVFSRGDRTYARLLREFTCDDDDRVHRVNIMVEKRFVGDKVQEVWFMVDDPQYALPWQTPSL